MGTIMAWSILGSIVLVVAILSYSLLLLADLTKVIGPSLSPLIMTSIMSILMTSPAVVLFLALELMANSTDVGVLSLCPKMDRSTFGAEYSGSLAGLSIMTGLRPT
jgi:hypothetical protein